MCPLIRETAYQAMLKELAVYEFNVGKTELLIETCAAQMADYAS